jgi:trehalose synthase-fused probable maltokinase
MSESIRKQPWSAFATGAVDGQDLAARLLAFARERRWFRAKTQTVEGARLVDLVPLDADRLDATADVLAVLEIRYEQHAPEIYVVPLAWAAAGEVAALAQKSPHAVIARNHSEDGLVDGLATGSAASALLDLVRAGGSRRGQRGELRAQKTEVFDEVVRVVGGEVTPRVSAAEQTNSTVMFGEGALLKVYRQLAEGPNPELEMGQFLSRACDPPCVPRVLGALTYTPEAGQGRSLGIVHELVQNRGDAWALAERELARFFDRAEGAPPAVEKAGGGAAWLAAARAHDARAASRAGRFVDWAAKLGRRTGDLHLALAGKRRPVANSSPDFDPEPLRAGARRALVDRARAMLNDTLSQLDSAAKGRGKGALSPGARELGEHLVAAAGRRRLERLLEGFASEPLEAVTTRTHGDLHLGQVLAIAGGGGAAASDEAIDDFMIIDFEGEPARPLEERRAKSSPLRDVMGMARSFDYASAAALRAREQSIAGSADRAAWGKLWTREVTAAYLRAYFDTVGDAPFIPRAEPELARLLTYYELEKVIYEVGYELNNRPAWVGIPLAGLAAVAGIADKDT